MRGYVYPQITTRWFGVGFEMHEVYDVERRLIETRRLGSVDVV